MIKVNISTQAVSREAAPANLQGLDTYTLNNLQTELNPVPDDLIDIEYWNENPVATPFDAEAQKLGDEILTIDVPGHVVDVSHQVVALTAQEIDDNLDAAKQPKYAEIWAYANSLIKAVTDAESPDRNDSEGKAERLSNKSQKRLTKKSKGQALTPQEEADEDWYDVFLDWADATNDIADLAEDAVEAMTLVGNINAYNAETTPAWPAFVAP